LSLRPGDESVLRDWLSVLSRQRWIVLLAVTVVPLLAFAASHSQQRVYKASATVLLNGQNPTAAEALNLASASTSAPDRFSATQAKLARLGVVAELAVRAPGVPDRTAAALLANSSVSANPTDDLLTFSVSDPVPGVATRLTNAYARAFTQYRHRLDTAALSAALRGTQRKLDAIVAAGGGGSTLFRRLEESQRNLEDLRTLQAAASSATPVGRADSASLVQPRTKRNVILGVIVGLALGIGLAFLREALDTRVHSADELRELLGVPLLGQVPKPARRFGRSKQLVTLADPTGASTEAFRILKNNLEISQLEHHAGSIAITSASEDDGGSATAANLAAILARSGRRVILADLDLRHPGIACLFGLRERPGLTGVALGVPLVDALVAVDVDPDRPTALAGALEVLTVGKPPPDPGGFLLSSAVAETLEVLEKRCDVLLIVTPPLLAAGDAVTIASHADALILVAGVGRVRREALAETRCVLERCPTFTLGVIATGAKATDRGNYRQRFSSAKRRARNGRVAEASGKPFAQISASVRSIVSAPARRRQSRRARPGGSRELGPSDGARDLQELLARWRRLRRTSPRQANRTGERSRQAPDA
jgi:polysaccharide biosynthesis transport protein